MWRLLGLVFVGLGFWAASLVLPRSDEQRQLISLIGIATQGNPQAYSATDAPVVATEPAKAGGSEAAVPDMNVDVVAPGSSPTPSKQAGATLLQPASAPVMSDADREVLTTRLQQELRRVGCYRGRVDGQWGSASRRAAQRFADKVNAVLSTDAPDYAALMLLEKFGNRACGEPCGPGSIPNEDGRCVKADSTQTADAGLSMPVLPAKPAVKTAAPSVVAPEDVPAPVPATKPDKTFEVADLWTGKVGTADTASAASPEPGSKEIAQSTAAANGATIDQQGQQSVFVGDDAFRPDVPVKNGKAAHDAPAPSVDAAPILLSSNEAGWDTTVSPTVPTVKPKLRVASSTQATAAAKAAVPLLKPANGAQGAGQVTVIAVVSNGQTAVVSPSTNKQKVAAKKVTRSTNGPSYYALGFPNAKFKVASKQASLKRRSTYGAYLRTAYRVGGAGSLR